MSTYYFACTELKFTSGSFTNGQPDLANQDGVQAGGGGTALSTRHIRVAETRRSEATSLAPFKLPPRFENHK
jgi:hypothetical protein